MANLPYASLATPQLRPELLAILVPPGLPLLHQASPRVMPVSFLSFLLFLSLPLLPFFLLLFT